MRRGRLSTVFEAPGGRPEASGAFLEGPGGGWEPAGEVPEAPGGSLEAPAGRLGPPGGLPEDFARVSDDFPEVPKASGEVPEAPGDRPEDFPRVPPTRRAGEGSGELEGPVPAPGEPLQRLGMPRPVVEGRGIEIGAVRPDQRLRLRVDPHLLKERAIGERPIELAGQEGREVDHPRGLVLKADPQGIRGDHFKGCDAVDRVHRDLLYLNGMILPGSRPPCKSMARSALLYEPVQHLEELIQLLSLRRQLFGRWRER